VRSTFILSAAKDQLALFSRLYRQDSFRNRLFRFKRPRSRGPPAIPAAQSSAIFYKLCKKLGHFAPQVFRFSLLKTPPKQVGFFYVEWGIDAFGCSY
jgi:hypothetical protein